MTVRTAPDPGWTPPVADASAGVLYHRWHRYDDSGWVETKKTRLPFLRDVGSRIDAVARSDGYGRWHARYAAALGGLGVESFAASNLWRLVTGTATNPALESGLQLHPLWGVPYLPGSSVKGLLHHYAEAQVVEEAETEGGRALTADVEPSEKELEAIVRGAREVRQVFGSLVVERGEWERDGASTSVGPETPRSLLSAWLRPDRLPAWLTAERAQELRRELLGPFTSGRLAVYDALPSPGQHLVEADILNPHYPEYYRTAGDAPPSDDQDPSPVYFLAVRAGVEFEFRWRLCPRVSGATAAMTDEEIAERVGAWLREALATWGAGAKTAAGYGYFETGAEVASGSGCLEAGAGGSGAGTEREIWEGSTVEWMANVRELVARDGTGRMARGAREQLELLPQSFQDQLTGGPKREGEKRGKRKKLRLDVEVLVKGGSYFEIVGFSSVKAE